MFRRAPSITSWRSVTLFLPCFRGAGAGTIPSKIVRQLILTGLGRDAPTVIITNDTHTTTKELITRYARRMTIEQRLTEIICAFHADALSSAVNLNVDLDIMLCVLAQALLAALRTRLPGYATLHPRRPPTPLPRNPQAKSTPPNELT